MRRRRILADTQGISSLEHVVVLALITIVALSAWRILGAQIEDRIAAVDRMLGEGPSAGALSAAEAAALQQASAASLVPVRSFDSTEPTDEAIAAMAARRNGTFLSIASGFVFGSYDVFEATLLGALHAGIAVYRAVSSPRETADAIVDAVTHPAETARAVASALGAAVDGTVQAGRDLDRAVRDGNVFEVSRTITKIGISMIPVAKVALAVRRSRRILVHTDPGIASWLRPRAAPGAVLERFTPGSGFSGVYSPRTGEWVALPSGDATLLGGRKVRTVPVLQGHVIAEEVLADRARRGLRREEDVGFVLVWQGRGTAELRWNSRSVNERNFGDRSAPAEHRARIRRAIERDTGARVIEGEPTPDR